MGISSNDHSGREVMGTRRSRRDDEDDDRPRHRREDDDEEDDRPRRRRRDDEDARPARRPRRKRRGPGAGLIVGIIGGLLGLVGLIVLVVMLARGSADISYDKFKAIDTGDTIEGLEKKFGSATKIDPRDWDSTYLGDAKPDRTQGARDFHVSAGSPLGSYNDFAREVTSWYRWRKGSEEIYVAEGTDVRGRQGLVIKVYWNPKVVEEAVRNPGRAPSGVPWLQVVQIGVGGVIQFGGSR
jgi:hypothetical protein